MENTEKLINFIAKSTDCYHAVQTAAAMLEENGFKKMRGANLASGKYYITRNSSSIIAFEIPENDFSAFMICASHTDSPSFKLKPNFETESANMIKLGVEGYGGMTMYSWFDRPLSVSGRVTSVENGRIKSTLVNIDRDLLIIPSIAIHLERKINTGYEFNAKNDMYPVSGTEKGAFIRILSEYSGIRSDDIKGFDLYLYNRMKGSILGTGNEFFSAPRIDDLQCMYSTLDGFIKSSAASDSGIIPVFAAFDNEEVGSGTKQGAKSDFLRGTLEEICEARGKSGTEFKKILSSSFMMSCDNAHAVHPNHADKSDGDNGVYMNGGIVIKHNANQHYTTDAISEAAVKYICETIRVPYQSYANRSDMAGGSTLGNLSNEKVSINTADIGLAQLAMHSSYETAGTSDTSYMIDFAKTFFSKGISIKDE